MYVCMYVWIYPSPPSQADVNSRGGTRRRTALHYASLHDHVEVAKLLLETGANEFTRDVGGYTPLNLSNGGKMCKLLHKVCMLVIPYDLYGLVKKGFDKTKGRNNLHYYVV